MAPGKPIDEKRAFCAPRKIGWPNFWRMLQMLMLILIPDISQSPLFVLVSGSLCGCEV